MHMLNVTGWTKCSPQLIRHFKIILNVFLYSILSRMSAEAKTFSFTVAMTCEACAKQVHKVLGKLGESVTDVTTDVPSKTVTCKSTLSADQLVEQLKKTGKDVQVQ